MLLTATVVAAACTAPNERHDSSMLRDLRPPVSSSDLMAPQDAADLAVVVDMAEETADLEPSSADLAASADLRVDDDLAPVADLSALADLLPAPDMRQPRDLHALDLRVSDLLPAPPDLLPASDLRRQCAPNPGCGDCQQQALAGEHCDDGVYGSASCTPSCQLAAEVLYDPRTVPTFYLRIDNPSWNTMKSCAAPPGKTMLPECDYQPATFYAVYDPTPGDGVDDTVTTAPVTVGLRRKGRATWQDLEPPEAMHDGFLYQRDGKPSFKIRFDANGGKKFLGLSRMTLNNGVQDPSAIRERLGYRVMRAVGIEAPLANSARLFVKSPTDADFTYWGLYVNLQTIDKQYVKFHWGTVDGEVGNLYDTYNDWYYTDLDRCLAHSQAGDGIGAQEDRFEPETNDNPADLSDLTALINTIYIDKPIGCYGPEQGAATFVASVDAVLDLDAFLRSAAVDALLTNWDGFAGARNNYMLYHELVRDRFLLLPVGIDQTMGWRVNDYRPNWSYALDHAESGLPRSWFMQRCIAADPDCWSRYLTEVSAQVAIWNALPLAAEATAMAAQVRPYVDWSLAEFDRHQLFVQQYLTTRAACVTQSLSNGNCAALSCPDATSCDPSN